MSTSNGHVQVLNVKYKVEDKEYTNGGMTNLEDIDIIQKPVKLNALTVDHVNVKFGDRQILNNVSMYAESGSILAIMGPSGSGKTTTLNAIAGRVSQTSGDIKVNNKHVAPRIRKKFGYVTQQDVFFPQLTLHQTLQFAANIKLSSKISASEKTGRINDVIEQLNLEKCRDTMIGNVLIPGLSGGEKKRVNIACELIRNPQILLLDEPTSGLDASLAMTIIKLLQKWAEKGNRIVITSIHQPSSQIFHIFDRLTLMTDGYVTFFGYRKDMVDYFDSIEVPFHPHWNPADFMLEVVNANSDKKERILKECARFENLPHVKDMDALSDSPLESETSGIVNKSFELDENSNTSNNHHVVSIEQQDRNHQYKEDEVASWWTQYKALTMRSFLVTKTRYFNIFPVIQFAFVALIVGLLWFRVEKTEQRVGDLQGVLFFVTINLSFQPLFDAIMTFHEDMGIVKHERRSGMYHISAYYMAKMSTEMPMMIILPFCVLTIIFWMTGLGTLVGVYFAFVFSIIMNVLACQGIGIFFSLLTDIPKANLTSAFIFMMFSLLTGGFFTTGIPSWLQWAKWLSFIRYCFHFNFYMVFSNMEDILCAPSNVTTVEYCKVQYQAHLPSNVTKQFYYPAFTVIKNHNEQVLEPWQGILVIVFFFLLFRFCGYLLFRFFKRI